MSRVLAACLKPEVLAPLRVKVDDAIEIAGLDHGCPADQTPRSKSGIRITLVFAARKGSGS